MTLEVVFTLHSSYLSMLSHWKPIALVLEEIADIRIHWIQESGPFYGKNHHRPSIQLFRQLKYLFSQFSSLNHQKTEKQKIP